MYSKMRLGDFHKVWRRKKNVFLCYFKVLYWTTYSYLTNKKILKLFRSFSSLAPFPPHEWKSTDLACIHEQLDQLRFKIHMVYFL